MHLSPAEYVIHVFGGVRATARAVEKYPSTICKWKRAKPHGSGGNVPSAAQRIILELAKGNRLDITPDDLAWGRDVVKKKMARA